MKLFITQLMIIVTLSASLGFAQENKQNAQIMAIKTGYLSKKMNLDPATGKNFWPLYYKYEHDRQVIRAAFRGRFPRDRSKLTEAQALDYVHARLQYEEDKLNLKKKYSTEFMQLISAKQLALLYRGEWEFKKMLIRQLNNPKPMKPTR